MDFKLPSNYDCLENMCKFYFYQLGQNFCLNHHTIWFKECSTKIPKNYQYISKGMGESMIKYTFRHPCQKKYKVVVNQAFNISNFKILFNLMINMNIFFEFMSMILKNHMLKVDFK